MAETSSGLVYDPAKFKAADVCLEDVAHHLAMQCRWGGACREFYSIAEHALLVERFARDRLETTGLDAKCKAASALACLHHDSAEAYMGDVTAPWRAILPDYDRRYAEVERIVLAALGVGQISGSNIIPWADQMARCCEAWNLMPSRGSNWSWSVISEFEARCARGYQLKFLSPRDAEFWFLHQDAELRKALEDG